jgi:hypothetical protein
MVNEQAVLEAISAVWDEADNEESEWGFPQKMALRSVAEKLGITNEYYVMLRSKNEHLYD